MAISSNRRARAPGFLARLPRQGARSLFPDPDGDAQLLFGGPDAEADIAAGVESLSAPLPPPPSQMPDERVERLGRAIQTLQLNADRLAAEVAANAIEIGCLVARRILEAEVKADVEAMRSLVRSAVRRLGEAHKVTIHLAPVDLEAVQAAAGDAAHGDMGMNLGIAKVEILPDTNLTPGDCFVESDAATVDGRLGTRLEEIRRVLSTLTHNNGDPTP